MNNNNRGNNNRRRGRSNNNRQQGGGQQVNRIDSRARGNAPQLLEKYRKLAHDAHLNGDRVTEEYNLQFADHYFRVLADQRQRQEEQRQPRTERWQEGGDADREESDTGNEYGTDNEYPSPYNYGERREREAPRFEERAETAAAEAAAAEAAPDRAPERGSERAAAQPREDAADANDTGETAAPLYEPAENPFTRDNNRAPRGLKPRRPRRDAAETRSQDAGDDNVSPGLNLAALPPAISPREDVSIDVAEVAEAKPKRRAPRRKPVADSEGGEPLKAAS